MNGMVLPIILIVGLLIVCAVAIYAIMMMEHKRKKSGDKGKRLKIAKRFKFLNDNFLTRKTFRRVSDQIASLSIYSFEEIQELAVNYYTNILALCLLVVVVGIIAFQDITAALLCICFAYVMFDILLMKRIDAVHFEVLKEFSSTLGSIRETYTIAGNIPDAINDCHKGKLLPKALDKIYLILTSTNVEDRLEEFYRTTPFPMLQTLAGVCFLLNDAGDEVDEKGVSAFKNAITLLKNECDLEVRKLIKQKLMFSFLEYLPLFPLPFIGVLKWFFVKYMPGTSVIYNGVLGYISQTVIILLAIFAYWYITTTCSPNTVRRDDRSEIVEAFMYWKPFKNKILPNILPKKTKTRLRIQKQLQGALSNKDIKYLYSAKVLVAGVCLVASLVMLLVFTSMAKDYTYNNVKTATFLAGGNMTVEEEKKWREFDAQYLERPRPPTNSDLINNGAIASAFGDLNEMDIKEQADRIIGKYRQYHALKFHWWYILIGYLFAFIGWNVPERMVAMRKKLVKSEEEEDVLQLQTMLAILRYTNLETMEALYWLARQSRIHQTAIYYAYHEYPSNPEMAIERLRDKSELPEFQQICERLLSTISQVTIKDAFSDLESERDHMLRIREMVQTQALERKRRQCSPISRAPLMALAFGHMMMPIGVLAYNEITNMLTQLSGV